ncbi:MAG TPA: dihydrofolate reductase family protein [Candidatus Saccharimonadales bacterium]|nr:dihydrofolate reductase family protein [Candidatus Saccharimonadales bacterium]
MGNIIMWNVVSVDGCFEGTHAWDLGHHQAVWGEELQAYVLAQLKTASLLIFGRNTYTGMAAHWTKAVHEPEAPYMNAIPKIVCSTTLSSADWEHTTIVRDAVAELSTLKQQSEGNMFVFGSANLSKSLMTAGLFDEYRICIAPVVLGKGRRLFPDTTPYQKLTLLECSHLKNGGIIVRYGSTTQ